MKTTIEELLYILITALIFTLIGCFCLNIFTFGLVATIVLKVVTLNCLISSIILAIMLIVEFKEYKSQIEEDA